jgi:hypothetical protein
MKIFLKHNRTTILEYESLIYEGYSFYLKIGKGVQRLVFNHYLN